MEENIPAFKKTKENKTKETNPQQNEPPLSTILAPPSLGDTLLFQRRLTSISWCGGLTLAGHAATLLLGRLTRWGEDKTTSSWVEMKTGRSLTDYCHGQNTRGAII